MDSTVTWQRLCALLDDDPEVWAAVEAALAAEDGDPWSALLDGLDDAGALAYLQSDDTGMELAEALAQLPRVVAAQPDLDEANDTDDLGEATRLADSVLAEHGLTIVRLIEDEGSWPLVVVPTDRIAALVDSAKGIGERVVPGG